MLIKTRDTGARLRANEARMADVVAETHPTLSAGTARTTSDLTRLAAIVAAHSGADTSIGILKDIVEQAPRLSAAVKALERDHRELPGLILELRMQARQLQSDIEEAFSRLAEHHRQTQHLVYEAFATDLGDEPRKNSTSTGRGPSADLAAQLSDHFTPASSPSHRSSARTSCSETSCSRFQHDAEGTEET